MIRKSCPLVALLATLFALTRIIFADGDADAPPVTVKYSTGATTIEPLKDGVKFFINRRYPLGPHDPELNGLMFTYRAANKPSNVTIDIAAGATVYLLIDRDLDPTDLTNGVTQLHAQLADTGWTKLPRVPGGVKGQALPDVYKQTFTDTQHLTFADTGFSGIAVASANLILASAPPPTTDSSPPDTQPAPTTNPDQPTTRPSPDNAPIAGPTTRIAVPQATVNILAVHSQSPQKLIGQADEFILTVAPGDSSQLVTVNFVPPMTDQMSPVVDDVLRYIHVKYPNWYADKAEFTFGDTAPYDNPSIGAAIATLIRSVIEGFPIDPNAAITGDIAANGSIHPITGLSYKLHAAAAGDCTIVAIPTKNYETLIDVAIYNGTSIVTDVQVFGISNLDEAVAVMRTDRDPKLAQAIAQFAKIQDTLKNDPHALHTPPLRSELQDVLNLAPNHLSAKLLLMLAQKKEPPTLSPTASLYYTNTAVNVMLPILKDRANFDTQHQIAAATIHQELADLDKLRPIADPNIQPLIDAWTHFLRAWSARESGGGSSTAVDTQFQKLTDEIATVNANPDINQKLPNEGI